MKNNKMFNLPDINSFEDYLSQENINPLIYDFKFNGTDLDKNISNKELNSYIDFLFEYEKIDAIDRDRCELIRDIYSNIYKIDTSKAVYAGIHEWSYDTINTFQTTYQQAIKLYCNDLFSDCKNGILKVNVDGHKRISRKWLTKVHKELLLHSVEYKEMNNLEYIQQFAHWTDTIGNFVLIPFYYRNDNGYILALNNYRGCNSNIKDYFDLSISAVYDSYYFMKLVSDTTFKNDFELEYINKFFMEDYFIFDNVDEISSRNLFPRKSNKPLPQDKIELKKCILEMIIRIINRGVKITNSNLCNNCFSEYINAKEYNELIQKYIECSKIDLCINCKTKCLINDAYNNFININRKK